MAGITTVGPDTTPGHRRTLLSRSPIGDGSRLSRRQFLRSAATLGLSAAGLALLDGCGGQPAAPGVAKEALETTTIRLARGVSVCLAAQYLAEETLKTEGFTQVQYVEDPNGEKSLPAGDFDIGHVFAASAILPIDAGGPLAILSGVHIGCWELFGAQHINKITDLKGQTIPIFGPSSSQHLFVASLVAWAGMDPNTDLNWVTIPAPEQGQALAEGKVDAVLAFPPTAQELRAKKIGHVILNSMMDMPWSQYFCCMVAANREFMQKNPVATKRVLRAILKATDIVAREPERAARFLVDKGYTKNYDYALDAMKNIPYNKWREYDPADTLRFYALRLRDAGMIKSSPDQIIAKGTDWRFLNELKVELKG
jgi:NitT/TauT family transport system substrate-binding protein